MPGSIVDRIAAPDGTSLLRRRWPSGSGSAWATVLLLHGLAEHSGRWEHVGRHLAAAGLDVEATDLRGFGGSGGRRAWVDRWSQLHDDLEERVVANRAAADRPIALYGHSLGGLVALGYVLDGRSLPDALVLSAPGIDVAIPGWQRLLALVLGRLAPGITIANGFDPTVLSRDPEIVRAYGPDPLNVHRTAAGFAVRSFAEQARVRASLDRLTLPTLVIHGAEDRLVPPSISEPLDGRPGVTRRMYPGIRHELHNEPEGPAILDDVVAWLREHVPPAEGPSGTLVVGSRQLKTASGERARAESVASHEGDRPQTRRT